jgi:tetratricopeptide (TPR) repeat protein
MADSPRLEELRRRVLLDPASIAFAALAEEYRRAGRYVEAISTCRAGLQRHPAYLSARVTLGRALLELGQYDEARDQLEQVLKVAPENLAAIRGLAEMHERLAGAPDARAESRAREQRPAPLPVAGAGRPPNAPAGLAAKPVSVMAAGKTDPAASAASATFADPMPPLGAFDLTALFEGTAVLPQPEARPAHPALPALEAFLDAIMRAKVRLESHDSDCR